MLIDRRNALMAGKRTPTAKNYVQDGLVAMWDGIENAGWGVHDANATVCKDLIGGLQKSCVTFDNFFKAQAAGGPFNVLGGTSSVTLEVCARYGQAYGNRVALSDASGPTEYIQIRGASMTYGNVDIRYRNPNDGNSDWYAFGKANTHTVSIAQAVAGIFFTYRNGMVFGNRTMSETTYNYITIAGTTTLYNELHSVRLYSRALTADEIAANYAIDKARFGLP